jgi:DNA-binding PadR family transcriptional regulator
VNNGENQLIQNKLDELSKDLEAGARTAEENRIRFHQLIKKVSDTFRSQGVKAREERVKLGGPNLRPLEEFEQKVLAATLALAGEGELAEITARVGSKPTGDSAVYFALNKFEGEGFIVSEFIRATDPEKRRVLFKVTEEGMSVLAEAERAEELRNANPQTLSITLPALVKEFADSQIGSGRYSSVSEYVRALIREDQKRQKSPSGRI